MNNLFCGLSECSAFDALYMGLAVIAGVVTISAYLLNKILHKLFIHIAVRIYMRTIKNKIMASNLTQHCVTKLLGLPLVLWSPTDTPCIRAHWVYPSAFLSTKSSNIERLLANITNCYMQRTGICLHVQFNLAGSVERIYWQPNDSFAMMRLNPQL